MNHNFPVYTVANSCQDCFKCVRHCPCKAIKVVNGSASVMPELCVACGRCVRVCPAHAKKIRQDLSRARFLLDKNPVVYASLAPSYVSYFKNIPAGKLVAAIRKLGFAGVSETALGAQVVSLESGRYVDEHGPGVYISSACPAAVDYIQKYIPAYAPRIIPVFSPLLSHTKMLRKLYGENIGVVFFGPCAAKKREADNHHELLDLALTFADLEEWFKQENIKLEAIAPTEEEGFVPGGAEEGRVYSFEGGMNDTMRRSNDDTQYVAISGLGNINRILGHDLKAAENKSHKVFIECLACEGGCVNGPAMPEEGSTLSGIIATAKNYHNTNSRNRKNDIPIDDKTACTPVVPAEISENDIKNALLMIGKRGIEDELNCGGCGYYTCRSFARALIEGKAETPMCLSYLRQSAQKKSNALIRYIPAGVVIADNHLKIIECNENFAELFDEGTKLAYEATPGLPGVELSNIVSFCDLFEAALASGSDVIRENYIMGDKILDISIFTIEPHRIVGAIVQDVTKAEMHREHISEKAREVIQKNVITVQKIAHYLGEHMAETEVLLREVASGYSSPKDQQKK